MKNVLEKSCRENKNTQFTSSNFFSEYRTVCEVMLKNLVKTKTTNDVTVWRIYVEAGYDRLHMHSPMLLVTHTNTYASTHAHTHTQAIIILISFPRQQ